MDNLIEKNLVLNVPIHITVNRRLKPIFTIYIPFSPIFLRERCESPCGSLTHRQGASQALMRLETASPGFQAYPTVEEP
jgi:hypothetical protein